MDWSNRRQPSLHHPPTPHPLKKKEGDLRPANGGIGNIKTKKEREIQASRGILRVTLESYPAVYAGGVRGVLTKRARGERVVDVLIKGNSGGFEPDNLT